MKNLITTLVFSFIGLLSVHAADNAESFPVEECEMNRRYIGAGAMLTLPGGDADMRRLGGGAVRCGYYFAEFWAVETEIASLENYAGLSASVLWHWWGYERIDPFFTLGAKGWIGHDNGQAGPKLGTGFFYHLSDSLSLRFDADFTLGVEDETETVHSVSAGIQYSF